MTSDSNHRDAANTAGRARADVTTGPESDQVLVRMYGQGVGDCFLLTFPRSPVAGGAGEGSTGPVHVLVDCGVISGTPGGGERMRQIVQDIKNATRDDTTTGSDGSPKGHLDLLIVTHEHMDHLSGFLQAEDEWKDIQVDKLWLAWTENPDSGGLPDSLKKALEKHREALALAADRVREFGMGERNSTLLGLMSFLVDADEGQPFAVARGVEDAMKAARALVSPDDISYCEPGDVLSVPGTAARAYVLGPPRSDRWLMMTNPSARDLETYEDTQGGRGVEGSEATQSRQARSEAGSASDRDRDLSFSLRRMVEGPSSLNAFATPLLKMMPSASEGDAAAADAGGDRTSDAMNEDLYQRSLPFDWQLRVPMPDAELAAAHQAKTNLALESYFDETNHWRRIDHDWLGAAEEFALRVDNLTNNTALVIAFELPPGTEGAERKVLLFVADAQVGNWLSWNDITNWRPAGGIELEPGKGKADLTELLGRTVFYKVGHHGSHNATLKARGVERMGRAGELTSFVPVSPPVAHEIKGWSRMPLPNLLEALVRRGHGRVVLPNEDEWPATEGADQVRQARARMKEKELRVSDAQLAPKYRAREKRAIEGPVPLYVELCIKY